jgi:predicted nucleic acid-binding protein
MRRAAVADPMAPEAHFFDTNVLLYLLSADARKADRAEALLAQGGTVSVQVLNEFLSVATRKARLPLSEAAEVLAAVRASCAVVPLTVGTHDRALDLLATHSLSVYDALIVAAALDAACTTLWTEDMQHGQLIDGRLRLRNPFVDDVSAPR